MAQVRDLGATKELLTHHLQDLDTILAALRRHHGGFNAGLHLRNVQDPPELLRGPCGMRLVVLRSVLPCPVCLPLHHADQPPGIICR